MSAFMFYPGEGRQAVRGRRWQAAGGRSLDAKRVAAAVEELAGLAAEPKQE